MQILQMAAVLELPALKSQQDKSPLKKENMKRLITLLAIVTYCTGATAQAKTDTLITNRKDTIRIGNIIIIKKYIRIERFIKPNRFISIFSMRTVFCKCYKIVPFFANFYLYITVFV